MKNIQYGMIVAALMLGMSSVANADHHDADGKHCYHKKHMMQDIDANKDGAISRDEFMAGHQARADKMFAKMDANNDGTIDATERKAMHANMGDHCNKKDCCKKKDRCNKQGEKADEKGATTE